MSYSTSLLWLEMAVLTCCVALSIKSAATSRLMWVALAIVAHQAVLLVAREDQLLFDVAVSALIYLGLLKLAPNAARVWLCAGGALAGAVFLAGTGLSIIGLFQDGWDVFGLIALGRAGFRGARPVDRLLGRVPLDRACAIRRKSAPTRGGKSSKLELVLSSVS